MFAGRRYQPVAQDGDSDSDTGNETAFFSIDNGSRKWRIGAKPEDLSQDLALDIPYVHPTIPVETKRIDYNSRYTRRQVMAGSCVLCLILVMVVAFSVAIILGQKYIAEDLPGPGGGNGAFKSTVFLPLPTPLMTFAPTTSPTYGAGATTVNSSPTEIPLSGGKGGLVDNSPSHEPSYNVKRRKIDWEQTFIPTESMSSFGTECSIEMFDFNKDGVSDLAMIVDINLCGARLVAMDGGTGGVVWQKEVNFPAFAVRCELDVNLDGVMDCLVAGRGGGFAAIDGGRGTLLWEVDPSIVFPLYNFYFPLVVRDLDDDGVDDIINMHGGDGSYKPEEHDRSPAYLVVVSGKTGQSLMPPMLTPDGHESYMSPVLFKLNGKDDFVLFGSGGETVPGSLWAVSIMSIKNQILLNRASQESQVYQPFANDSYHPCFMIMNKTDFNAIRPTYDLKVYDFQRPIFVSSSNGGMRFCPRWSNINPIWNKYGVCLYELMKTEYKGVMVPPVMVDLDQDGIDDLVVSTFEGHTTAISGYDAATRLWDVHYPNTESYSVPAPLLYNQDSVPDLMIRSNLGEWDSYTLSTTMVLDGRNGAVLWTFDSAHGGMSSGISIAASAPGFDAMLFIGIGNFDSNSAQSGSNSKRYYRHNEGTSDDNIINQHQTGDSSNIENEYLKALSSNEDPQGLWDSTPQDMFPNPHTDFEGFLAYCGESMADLTTSLWLVDREMVERRVDIKPLATHKPYLYTHVTATELLSHAGELTGHAPTKRHGDTAEPPADSDTESFKSQRCRHIAKPLEAIGTPVVGDFNADSHLEVSYSVVWQAALYGAAPVTKVFTFTLKDRFKELYQLHGEVKGQELVNFDLLLPSDWQPWNKYMGRYGNNRFKAGIDDL